MHTVYLVSNILTGAVYVGKTSRSPVQRWRNHRYFAKLGYTNCRYLYRALRKYGEENFRFDVLETYATEAEALQEEVFLIAYLRSLGADLYNLTEGGEGVTGARFSKEVRQKMSEAHRGRPGHPVSDDARRKISEALRGRPGQEPSEETKRKISEGNKGQKRSEEARRRMSKAAKMRPPISEETRRRMSEAQRRRQSPSR